MRKKVFLYPLQIIDMFEAVLSHSTLKNPLRCAVQLMIGFFAGVRVDEMRLLRIEHFEIGKNTGLLLQDDDGYGKLHILAEISKGGYSPSPAYGTLIVPRLRVLINTYLSTIYESYPDRCINVCHSCCRFDV